MISFKVVLMTLGVVLGTAAALPAGGVAAQSVTEQIQKGVNDIGGNDAANSRPLGVRVKRVVNVFLYVIGAVAVLMVTYGGFKYVTSAGNATEVTAAKNTILYAVVGLVIAVLAYAIVNFVATSLQSGPSNPCDDPANFPPPGTSGPTPIC